MANPNMPVSGDNGRLGYFIHKVSTTLTPVLGRAFGKSATSGASDVGHVAVATGEEGAAVASADSSIIPYVGIGGRDPSGNGIIARINADRSFPIAAELASLAALADGGANPTTTRIGAASLLFNGSTWDRQVGNQFVTLLASGARTTTQTSADQTNYNARGIRVFINITAGSSLALTVTIDERDPVATTTWRTLLTSVSLTGTGQTVLTIYPGLTAAANVTVNDVISRIFRVVVTAGNANSATYSLGYALLV